MKTKGIALVISCRVTWDNSNKELAISRSRSIEHTFDTLPVKELPAHVGPMAAYALISGSGNMAISLMLEAPNGEIVVAYHDTASTWGALGTWETVIHIDELTVEEPGIYHWQLYQGSDLLLDRPMLITVIDGNASKPETGTVLTK
jgi:hypothetical protein